MYITFFFFNFSNFSFSLHFPPFFLKSLTPPPVPTLHPATRTPSAKRNPRTNPCFLPLISPKPGKFLYVSYEKSSPHFYALAINSSRPFFSGRSNACFFFFFFFFLMGLEGGDLGLAVDDSTRVGGGERGGETTRRGVLSNRDWVSGLCIVCC